MTAIARLHPIDEAQDERACLRRATLALAVALAALGAANAPGATAQGAAAAQGAGQIEELMVTARRREENLQQVPVSVTAFSAGDINDIGITDISHISQLTTNLIIMPNTGGNDGTLVCMRGLCRTDFTITEDPMVGIYLDGVYIGKSIGSLFDVATLERVEVLRGPQGTLYGKNTVGGAVLLHTRKPSGELGGQATVTAGDYGRLDGKGYVEFPVTDGLAASLAVLSKNRDPFVDNTLGDDIWDEDNRALRAAVRWTPGDVLTIDYAYDWQEKRERAMVSQLTSASGVLGALHGDNVRPDRASKVNSFGPSQNDVDLAGHGLTIAWDIGDAGPFTGLVLKSITGYRESENYLVNNAMGAATPLLFNNPDHFDLDSASQEFQLAGSGFDGYADFVAGLFYFNEEGDYINTQIIDLFELNQRFYTEIDNTSLAAFGEVSLHLTEQLTASLGVRYTDEEREQNHSVTLDGGAGFTYFDTLGADLRRLSGGDTDRDRGHRLVAARGDQLPVHRRSDGLRGLVARLQERRLQCPQHHPAAVGALRRHAGRQLRGGHQVDVAGQPLRFNASVFYEDLSDMQAQVNAVDSGSQGGYSTVVQNAASATVQGLELETMVILLEGLELSAGYGYVDPEYDEFLSFDNITGAISDISDDRGFEYTPEHSYNLSLNYTFPKFTDNGLVRARIDWSGMSEHIFTPKLSGNDDIAQGDYDLLNLRLAWEEVALGDGTLTIAGWVRNAADEEYRIGGFEFDITSAGLGRASTSQWGEPRTWGVDVTYSFGSM